MLRQSENEASKGIHPLEDPLRPGYLVRGRGFTPDEQREARKLGLLDHHGRPAFEVYGPSPDPDEVTKEQYDPKLMQAVADAEAEVAAADERIGKALARRGRAVQATEAAIQRQNKRDYNMAMAEEQAAVLEHKEALIAREMPVVRLTRAQEALHGWIRRERATRQERRHPRPAARSERTVETLVRLVGLALLLALIL